MTTGNPAGDLFDSLRGAVASGLDLMRTRVSLFGIELEQEVLRAGGFILQALSALVLGFFAIGFIGFAVIVFFWDGHRQLAASLVAAFFVLLAAIVALRLRRALATRPRPFHSTIEAFERDCDALRGRR